MLELPGNVFLGSSLRYSVIQQHLVAKLQKSFNIADLNTALSYHNGLTEGFCCVQNTCN